MNKSKYYSMMNNPSMKLFYLILMILCCMMASTLNSLIMMWLFMEINTFLFIGFSMTNFKKNIYALINYIIPQIISSLLILFVFSLKINYYEMIFPLKTAMTLALVLKLGMIPLHSLIILVNKNLSWDSLFVMNTIQKYIPFLMMSETEWYMMYFFILLSPIISSIMILKQISFKAILGYSSITHSAWMSITFFLMKDFFIYYFLCYTILTGTICLFFHLNNSKSFTNMTFYFKKNNFMNIMSISLMLSYSSIPPFTGFMMKWIPMINISQMNLLFMMISMSITSIILMYPYMYMMYSTISKNSLIYQNFKMSLIFSMIISILFFLGLFYMF